jgi:hypothetical protein
MKKTLLFVFLHLIPYMSYCQCVIYDFDGLNFDNLHLYHHYKCIIQRDTINNPENIWQIGTPHKTVFDTAHSPARALVTDTVFTYPPGDTSSFIIAKTIGLLTLLHGWHIFGGYYNVNSDTLSDYCVVEFSPDNGHTWIDLMQDTTGLTRWTEWHDPKPVFSGNSFGWKHFSCELHFADSLYSFTASDTFLYKFTFISDTTDSHKDGLMFDNLEFLDWTEDVPTINNTNHIISLFPNPATSNIHIQAPANTSQKRVHILNYTGTLINEINNFTGNEIDVSDLPPGIYILKYTDELNSDTVPFSIVR